MKRLMVLALVLLPAVISLACGGAQKPAGVELDGAPAAEFRLTDQDGQPVTLAQFRGRPVLLTFLYTQCPDVCPVIANRTGEALRRLGADGGKVAVLAVSVDPQGDTPERARTFMATHGLMGSGRHYLLGDESALAPVWLAYAVGAAPLSADGSSTGPGPRQIGRVGHSDVLYLIDRNGAKRTLLRGDASADEIARGLRALLK